MASEWEREERLDLDLSSLSEAGVILSFPRNCFQKHSWWGPLPCMRACPILEHAQHATVYNDTHASKQFMKGWRCCCG